MFGSGFTKSDCKIPGIQVNLCSTTRFLGVKHVYKEDKVSRVLTKSERLHDDIGLLWRHQVLEPNLTIGFYNIEDGDTIVKFKKEGYVGLTYKVWNEPEDLSPAVQDLARGYLCSERLRLRDLRMMRCNLAVGGCNNRRMQKEESKTSLPEEKCSQPSTDPLPSLWKRVDAKG